jgi:hypothetical protein
MLYALDTFMHCQARPQAFFHIAATHAQTHRQDITYVMAWRLSVARAKSLLLKLGSLSLMWNVQCGHTSGPIRFACHLYGQFLSL